MKLLIAIVILLSSTKLLIASNDDIQNAAIVNHSARRLWKKSMKLISRSHVDDYGEDDVDNKSFHLDRHTAIACTNRYNCEHTCFSAKSAKKITKAPVIDKIIDQQDESRMTDAHKLGIQLGRHKSCSKCSLIYSNCLDDRYHIFTAQLSGYRRRDATEDDESKNNSFLSPELANHL